MQLVCGKTQDHPLALCWGEEEMVAMPRPWWGWSPLSAMHGAPVGWSPLPTDYPLWHELTHTGKISPSMLLRRLQLPMAVAWPCIPWYSSYSEECRLVNGRSRFLAFLVTLRKCHHSCPLGLSQVLRPGSPGSFSMPNLQLIGFQGESVGRA